jgi:hypothetical protein
MKPAFFTRYKFIFDFSFDVSPHLTYRRSMNKKDGFNGTLAIGDKLFPESADLGLGDIVTAENIDELTSIFTNESILTAVADSVATALPVSVSVPDIDAAVRFIRSRFVDVDFDPFPDRITIFGDDQRIPVSPNGDGCEGHFVLNLMRPVSLTANPFNE